MQQSVERTTLSSRGSLVSLLEGRPVIVTAPFHPVLGVYVAGGLFARKAVVSHIVLLNPESFPWSPRVPFPRISYCLPVDTLPFGLSQFISLHSCKIQFQFQTPRVCLTPLLPSFLDVSSAIIQPQSVTREVIAVIHPSWLCCLSCTEKSGALRCLPRPYPFSEGNCYFCGLCCLSLGHRAQCHVILAS